MGSLAFSVLSLLIQKSSNYNREEYTHTHTHTHTHRRTKEVKIVGEPLTPGHKSSLYSIQHRFKLWRKKMGRCTNPLTMKDGLLI